MPRFGLQFSDAQLRSLGVFLDASKGGK
jgi:hypothetical protein